MALGTLLTFGVVLSIATTSWPVNSNQGRLSFSDQQNKPSTIANDELKEADKLSAQVVKLYQQEKYEEAIPPAKQALKIRERVLGANDPGVADAVANVAMLYVAVGKFDDAESLFKRALRIYEKLSAQQPLLLAKTLENLASLRAVNRDFKNAEQLYLRALSIKEKTLGPDDPETLVSLHAVAAFYAKAKNHEQEKATLQKLITAKEKQLGESHQEVGRLLERLACAMHRNGDNLDAGKTEARANHILYGDVSRNPEPIPLPDEIFQCKLLTNPRPDFPAAARGGRLTGSTRLVVVVEVDETGNVTSANMASGNPLFKQASEKAALGAKLRPTVVDNRPVKVRGTIIHGFMVESRMVIVPGTMGRP